MKHGAMRIRWFDTLADTVAKVEAETLFDTRVDPQAQVDMLADTIAEVAA